MEAELARIRLKPGSRPKVQALIDYMQENLALPLSEMKQKGYFWDSVFFEERDGQEYLLVVIKAEDFSQTKTDDQIEHTTHRKIYNQFKDECWDQAKPELLEAIWCPNKKIEY